MARKGSPKTGGRKVGSKNKKVTPRDIRTLAAAEALRQEIEDRRPPPGIEMSKEIMGKFAHNCAAMAVRLMPSQEENGKLKFRFDEHEMQWKYMMELVARFTNNAAPYQSPTFRAVMITPPLETKAGESARIINLTVFEGGKAVTTTEIVEDKAS